MFHRNTLDFHQGIFIHFCLEGSRTFLSKSNIPEFTSPTDPQIRAEEWRQNRFLYSSGNRCNHSAGGNTQASGIPGLGRDLQAESGFPFGRFQADVRILCDPFDVQLPRNISMRGSACSVFREFVGNLHMLFAVGQQF